MTTTDGSDRCAYVYTGYEFTLAPRNQRCDGSKVEHGIGRWSHAFVPPESRSAQAWPGCGGTRCMDGSCPQCAEVPESRWLAWKASRRPPSPPVAESPVHDTRCPALRGRECECRWTPTEIAKAAEHAKDYEPLFKPVPESPPLPKPKCAGWREMEPYEREGLDERTFCDAEESSASGRPCPRGVCATDDNWHKPVAESPKGTDEAEDNFSPTLVRKILARYSDPPTSSQTVWRARLQSALMDAVADFAWEMSAARASLSVMEKENTDAFAAGRRASRDGVKANLGDVGEAIVKLGGDDSLMDAVFDAVDNLQYQAHEAGRREGLRAAQDALVNRSCTCARTIAAIPGSDT